ncbi:MAG: hypothetical protein H8E28_14800 [Anaerolineae bacterium]|nr:hypothetical protein [Anaerolineae bacterium]
MMIDLQKIKDWLKEPKHIAITAGAVVVLGIFILAIVSVVLPQTAKAEAVPTATPEPMPTATTEPTPIPTMTVAEPQPVAASHRVVWTNRETGIYLRNAPNDAIILKAIPNGEELTGFTEQTMNYGEVLWQQIDYQGQFGWIATEYIYTLTGDYLSVPEDGAWLFADMDGIVEMYLWKGSPFQVSKEVYPEVDEGFMWLEIRLPDDSTGWIKMYR